jgi:Reverse transcriptase (RNA-dependent DNA polymerase)
MNACDSSNYHGICLSSIFGKLFDNIVLKRYHDRLMYSELQLNEYVYHGVKRGIGILFCNNTTMYCSFLDATKAFDRIEYCKLFNLLMEWHIPTCIIKILINFYTNHHVRVAWCGVMQTFLLLTA